MKLTIRNMREDDLEDLHVLLSDPRVMRYLEAPFSREQTRRFLEKAGLSDPPRIYAAEEEGRFLGYVIYHDYDARGVEIGWVLLPELWGKGYASCLTGQLLELAGRAGKQAVIECAPEQGASRRIAEKYGFAYEGRQDGLDVFRRKPAGR